MSVTIVKVKYQEPEFQFTEECIDAMNLPVITAHRNGYGSLAKAINAGMAQVCTEYAFIVTNIQFTPWCVKQLISALDSNEALAAVSPVFNSDHAANRYMQVSKLVREVPFIEFTAALVRTDIFAKIPLDEDMPYWGHDLDWGHRIREAGYKIGVCNDASIEHTYIRFNTAPHPVTVKRKLFRQETDYSTTQALIKKYGNDWKRATGYF